MKKSTFLLLFTTIFMVCCTRHEQKYPVGGWQLIQTESIENGNKTITYPGMLVGTEYKMWSEKNFIFVGRWKEDSVITDNYGYGTYTLDKNDYTETILYHFNKEYEGQTIKMKMELRNDTLLQIYNRLDTTGKPLDNVSVEKYVRRR